jgi:hypothetical protein
VVLGAAFVPSDVLETFLLACHFAPRILEGRPGLLLLRRRHQLPVLGQPAE